MSSQFEPGMRAEMLQRDRPIEWRAGRLRELGLGVRILNWPDHDVSESRRTGAKIAIVNDYHMGNSYAMTGLALFSNQLGKQLKLTKRN
jgi:hydroxypyruvate isomerase